MFCRTKVSGNNTYLQIVENKREGKKTRQRVVATLGRLDQLAASGALDSLVKSACRFSEEILALSAGRAPAPEADVRSIGPALIFERLWQESGCGDVIRNRLAGRRYGFNVERAVFFTVLHRLAVSGSGACAWRQDQAIEGAGELKLHQLYRAMAWLGEPLREPAWPAPRCIKDVIEEDLFARRRDLFADLDLVFFDTTSLYFTGEGGDTIGQYGKSKDRRPDCKQMVLGIILDRDGMPICSEMWPGNTTDVTTLDVVAERLQRRFGIRSICLVADAGMISRKQVAAVEARGWQYILGARPRRVWEIREKALTDKAPFQTIEVPRQRRNPMELQVKEVTVEGPETKKGKTAAPPRRYIVCRNPAQARKDAADREAIIADLQEKLKTQGGLVGNKGYKRYLKSRTDKPFEVDLDKVREEERFDGIWVLRTNTRFTPGETALRYKQLWMVEQIFRTAKALLDTRPIFHKADETIRGHVFCSFLALMLQKELFRRLDQDGIEVEWDDVMRDLNALTETRIVQGEKRFVVRSRTRGVAGKIFQCAGVKLPSTIRRISAEAT